MTPATAARQAFSTAAQYIHRGWQPVPIPPGQKGPTLNEWQKLRIPLEDVQLYFRGGNNIGVILGEPSAWLVDVDLDTTLAVELADEFLPPTAAEFGRDSKPRSHRLYYLTEPAATKQWKFPKVGKPTDGQMVVELRSTGGQTVFPGSIHPSGEHIEWDTDGEPTAIHPAELQAALEALHAAVLKRSGIEQPKPVAPLRPRVGSAPTPDAEERARRYVEKIPPATSGQGGHPATFHVACVLVLGFNLTPHQAYGILAEWNVGCQPPWSERELWHKLDGADKQPGERGYLLVGDTPTATPLEPYTPPTEQVLTLDAWREEQRLARVASMQTTEPIVLLDRSPTGTGKSYANRAAMEIAGASLTLLPTHANCAERESELLNAGFHVAAIPERTDGNCRNNVEAKRAESVGLPVGAAVCPGCPFRHECPYLAGVAEAIKAPHVIATHARGAMQMKTLSTARPLVIIDEDAAQMLRPTLRVPLPALSAIEDALAEAAFIERDKSCPDGVAINWIERCRIVVGWLRNYAESAEGTTFQERELHLVNTPEGWPKLMWRAIRNVATLYDGTPLVQAEALKIVLGIAAGTIAKVGVQIIERRRAGGELIRQRLVVGVWQTKLPPAVVWLLDATGVASMLEELAGKPVVDATPKGRLVHTHLAQQIPHDITRRTEPAVVARWILGILAKHPEAKRVGIIGHRPHIAALFGEGAKLLPDEYRARIARWGYFGQGTDRASNSWASECDMVLVLGTPRVPPDAIATRLVQAGEGVAAGQPGEWGTRRWEGRTAAGRPLVVSGRGYAHPAWHRHHEATVVAAIKQAMGRARTILADGVPVLVITTEPTGLALAEPTAYAPMPAARGQGEGVTRLVEAAEAVRAIIAYGLSNTLLGLRRQWKTGPSTTQVADTIGVSVKNASKVLAAAASLGLVHRLPGHKAGWATGPPPTDGENTCQESVQTVEQILKDGVPGAPPAGLLVNEPMPEPATPEVPTPPASAPVQTVVVASCGIAPDAEGVLTVTTKPLAIAWHPSGGEPTDPADARELLEERAAIMEYEGGATREDAEHLAGLHQWVNAINSMLADAAADDAEEAEGSLSPASSAKLPKVPGVNKVNTYKRDVRAVAARMAATLPGITLGSQMTVAASS